MNANSKSSDKRLFNESFSRNISSSSSASKKQNVDNIDDESWIVCNKIWKSLETSVNDNDENELNERLAKIQVSHLQFLD